MSAIEDHRKLVGVHLRPGKWVLRIAERRIEEVGDHTRLLKGYFGNLHYRRNSRQVNWL
jgi:hypothetical protein